MKASYIWRREQERYTLLLFSISKINRDRENRDEIQDKTTRSEWRVVVANLHDNIIDSPPKLVAVLERDILPGSDTGFLGKIVLTPIIPSPYSSSTFENLSTTKSGRGTVGYYGDFWTNGRAKRILTMCKNNDLCHPKESEPKK
jgi:hypothetical protein